MLTICVCYVSFYMVPVIIIETKRFELSLCRYPEEVSCYVIIQATLMFGTRGV
jgi:hypothetical protein